MRPEVISLIIGVVTFIVVLLALLIGLDLRNRRQKELIVHRSFGRLAGPSGSANIDIPKEKEQPTEPAQDKNRWRFYAFGMLAAGVFGSLLARLWSLQLLSGNTYILMAEQNRRSTVKIPAIRGRLLDRKGRELVGNRATMIVTAPKSVADNRNLVHRLSLVLGVPKGVIRAKLLDDRVVATANRVLATDVSMRAVAYIQAHRHLFTDITVESSTIRYYPFGTLAAHLLGYIGPVTEDELQAEPEDSVYTGGDYIGKSGAEYAFEQYLIGQKGQRTFQVDVYGNPTELVEEIPASNGGDVCLTIDLDLQRATDRILAQVIASARDIGRQWCNAGALVAMDINDGGILAMSSYPTFNPEPFTQGISQDLWDMLNSEEADYPLINRVTTGRYPAASTFKAFTSLAGLHHGLINDMTEAYCTGFWDEYGSEWGQRCWIYPYGHGEVNFEEAVNQSCDYFFYNLAVAFYQRWAMLPGENLERPNELQEYLRTWGFGSATGLDGFAESSGRVPDAAWKKEIFVDTPELYDWYPGDMTNMVIGQGDLLVTPLQICNGYAGIARRKMLKPHIFHRVLDTQGRTLVSYQVRESDVQPEIDLYNIGRLEVGLRRVIERNGGPFRQLPVTVYGKTGTGEIAAAKEHCSWFVAYAPAENPQYCVACLVEQAGSGDSVAMPAVQQTLAAIYGVDIGPVQAGNGTSER
ncbi:MAG: penicillin-binding protein 2 [Coriobacteriales bacterium]|jgi:penicillin-binding protein 2|nr:penicillin-binding protein 2 [Coriobacteriales bacterium]